MSSCTISWVAFLGAGSTFVAAHLMATSDVTDRSKHLMSYRQPGLMQQDILTYAFDVDASTSSDSDSQLILGDCSLQQACVASGLSASSLAAAGLSTAQTASSIAAVKAAIAESGAIVQSAQNTLAPIRAERESLLRLAERGLLSDVDRLRLTEVESSYTTAVAALQSACSSLRTAAAANLAGDLQTAIQTVNDSTSTIPASVRNVVSSDAASVAVRNALANRRIANRAGQSFDPEGAAFALTTEQSNAVNDFQTRFPLVRETWITSTR